MLQLSRNGLRLQSLTSLDESQGSSNVKVSIQNDGTYTNYSTQLHYGYYVHGFSYTKGIARYENGVFILPREAFEQYGLLNLSVLLVSSDEELMTNQVQFIVKDAPRGDMVIDDIQSAQQQVLQLVQTTLDQYAHTINLNKNEIAVLKSRMDSFTSLQQGSTTGDAELIDGRVGYDGKTYENIGGAIRGQVSQLSDEIDDFTEVRINNYINDDCVQSNLYNVSNSYVANESAFSLIVPIMENIEDKTYTIYHKSTNRNRWSAIVCKDIPNEESSYSQEEYTTINANSVQVKVPSGYKYIYLWLYWGAITNEIKNEILNNLYVVEGDSFDENVKNLPKKTWLISKKGLSDELKHKIYGSKIKGKKILFFGDSFTAGYNRYHQYIAKRTECINLNYGLSGSAVTPTTDQYTENFLQRISGLPTDNIDLIVLWGGINDSWVLSTNRRQLGTIDDIYTDDNITVYGAFKKLCEDLITKYPNIPIIALLPPKIIDNNQSYAHARNINTIAEMEKVVYTTYGIPQLDMRSESGISTLEPHKKLYNNESTSTDDGFDMHWNAKAHEKISYVVQQFIEQHFN